MSRVQSQAKRDGFKDKPIIISVAGSVEGVAWCYIVLATSIPSGLTLLMEVNLSCPNIPDRPPPAYSKSELVRYLNVLQVQLDSHSNKLSIGLKVPPYTHMDQFKALIEALLETTHEERHCPISFITSTNTLGSCLILDNSDSAAVRSADGSGIGGLAGPSIHPISLGNVYSIRMMLDEHPQLRHIHIIGVGGVSDAAGFRRMKAVGASAVGVATALGAEGVKIFEKILKNDSVASDLTE